jgi:predicted MPP superfamily phosphohydrolase
MTLLAVGAFAHLFVAVYNRWLLCLTDSPVKLPLHALAFLVLFAIPALAVLLATPDGAVAAALAGHPAGPAAWFWYLVLWGAIILWMARTIVWAIDRVVPDHPPQLVEETVERPVMPPVFSALPRGLRALDTTGALEVVRRDITIAGLAPAFDGLRIVQVSDVHFGQRLSMTNYLEAVQDLVARLDGDLVVLTGDFVDRRRDIVRSVAYHSRFRGRLGTYCVLGNHDYWTRPEALLEELGRTPVRWLGGGARRVFRAGGRRLVLTGTDSPWDGRRPDWRRLVRRGPGDAVVLLSHTPDNAPAAARHGAALILSGHNHGGQIRLPLIGPMIVPSRHGLRFADGARRAGPDSVVNVSRGVGVSSGGVRILCPPEVTVITLRVPIVDVMVGRVVPARPLLTAVEGRRAAADGMLANRGHGAG